jgi:Ca2+-binding EF-hand superfamily protein
MASGVSGIGGYSYLGRLRQAQGEQKNSLFAKIDTNGDSSISKDEWTALRSGLTTQSQSAKSGSSGSALSLLSLLQNAAGSGTTGSSESSATAANASFAKIDTNGDGSLSKDEFNTALSSLLNYGTTEAGSYSATETLFAKIDTNGDGSLGTNELNAFQAGLTTQLLNGITKTSGSEASEGTSSTSTAAAFMQQAISKYMQFTPTGKGIAVVGSLLGLG